MKSIEVWAKYARLIGESSLQLSEQLLLTRI